MTDRYLFFPSVGAVILIAWGLISAGKWLGRRGSIAAVAILAGYWGLVGTRHTGLCRGVARSAFGVVRSNVEIV